jgi:cell division protein FtsQ
MSRSTDQRPEEPVPDGVDEPGQSVLDELLRAFSADLDDAEKLAAVDLTSPEVAQLLEPTSPSHAPTVAAPAPDSEPAGEPDDESHEEPPSESDDATPATGSPLDVEPTDGEPTDGEPTDGEPMPIDPLLQAQPDVDGTDQKDEPEPSGEGPQTIVISDDSLLDLPDAVYVEGSLDEPDGAATTVFIDDDRTGDDTYGASDAVRIEPRFRARRIAVRRSQGRRRLRWVIIGTLVLVLAVAGFAVLGSSWFAVSEVEVEGRTYSDEAAVDAVVQDLLDTPVLRVDTDAAEEQLEQIPWVEEAIVSTDFPHGAKIELRERRPVSWFRGADGRYRVIDREGRVLDVLVGEPRRFVPIESDGPPSPEPGEFAPRGYGAAASLVDAMTPTMRQQAQSVVTTADGTDLRLVLAGGTEVRFGRAEDLVNKLVRLQTVLDNESIVNPEVIDVATSEVTVR